MMHGELYRAANLFVSIDNLLAFQSSEIGTILSGQEVAFYVVLICLATMSRKELK